MKRGRRGRPGHDRPRPRLTVERLDGPVRHTARIVALEFLAVARAERRRLPDGAQALHDFRVSLRRLRSWLRAFRPWLRDTGRGRTRRVLATLADASNHARDAEVGLAWLDAQRDLPAPARVQLRREQHRLRRELRTTTRAFLRELEREFDPVAHALEDELAVRANEPFVASRANPVTRSAYARLVREHAAGLAAALDRVHGIEDEAFAHRARIAGKRLRYLLEPLAASPAARGAVRRLVRLQDALGELHDACVLGARLERAHSVLAHRSRERMALAFRAVARGWLGGRSAPVVQAATRVADTCTARAQ